MSTFGGTSLSRKSAGISSRVFQAGYLDRSREIYRRTLEMKPWIREMHSTFLGLKPGMKIVDVGCGTGDFSRYLAGLVQGDCKVIGVDIDTDNIGVAKSQTRKERMSGKISFRKGDAFNIPVEQGWADLVCCRCLLMHLPNPIKAVREMARVTRKDGTVAAFERGRFLAHYVPDDDKLTKSMMNLSESYFEGVRKLEGKNFDIGNRLPTIFSKAGLRDVKAEVETHAFLASDPRRKAEDLRDELEFYLSILREGKNQSTKAMLAGGASRSRINQYNRWLENWLRGLLNDNPIPGKNALFTTGGVGRFNTGGLVLVAGRTPRDRI